MASQTLLALTGSAPQNGPIVAFPQADNIRVLQFNPRPGVVFSGSVVVEGSYVASPGNNDFQQIATVTFTNHGSNFSMDVESDAPWVRVRLEVASVGEIAVFGTSRSGLLTGGQGVSLNNATAVVNSPLKVGVTGPGVHVAAPVNPAFSSDDVVYALDVSKTVTDKIDELETTVGATTASVADLDVLTGADSAGVTPADIQKLACITVSCAEINNVSGASGNLQAQLDTKATGPGVDLTGLTAPGTWIDTFFDAMPTITVSALSAAFTGLTATASDLNALAGTGGSVFPADFVKLGNITASAAEINALTGFTGTSTDLNKFVGLTASAADLDAVAGYAATGVTSVEIAYLSGLTQNVEAALNAATVLVGLTASVGDLNLLTGAATGTGAYTGPVSATEISYLDGLIGNIQSQLNNKRDVGTAIGISEISGAAITTTELNYSSGLVDNIQVQIDALVGASIGLSGGTFTGTICITDGSTTTPGLGLASVCTTGIYRDAPDGLGFAAGGNRIGGFEPGTWDWSVGDGVTLGYPKMKGTVDSALNPSFTFVQDEDTGLFHVGVVDSNTCAISAGGVAVAEFWNTAPDGRVRMGAPRKTGSPLAHRDKTDPADNDKTELDITALGQERLISKSQFNVGQNASPSNNWVLYTVPAARELLVTKIAVKLVSLNQGGAGADGADLFMNIGWNGVQFDELLENSTVTAPNVWNPTYGWDTPNQVIWLGLGDNTWQAITGSAGADYQFIAAGGQVTAHIDTTTEVGRGYADWDDFVIEILMFGYEQGV